MIIKIMRRGKKREIIKEMQIYILVICEYLKKEERNKLWQLHLCQSLNEVHTQSLCKWEHVQSNNTHNNPIITVIAILCHYNSAVMELQL